MKYFLCVLMACGVFSCGKSSTRPIQIVIDQIFTSDSYDSEGNIFIRDSRIKASHFYTINFNIVRNGVGHFIHLISTATPSLGIQDLKEYGLDSVRITLSDGSMRITDRDKKLLDHGQMFFEGDWSAIYLVIILEEDQFFATRSWPPKPEVTAE